MTKPLALARLVAVTAAFGISLYLFSQATHAGFTSPWFVLLAMLCLLGLTAFARPLFLLRTPRWLRRVRPWEIKGELYRSLGVLAFGRVLRRTPLRLLNPEVYLRHYRDEPAQLSTQLEGAEAAHYLAAAFVLPYMAYAAAQNWWTILFWFMVVQVLGHVYPILHLRWVRGRMERLSERHRHRA